MTTYVAIIANPARRLDPTVTAKTFPVIAAASDESVFQYIDTASSRAEINVATDKLATRRVAIIGLGGTGSYVLDLIAKTPVLEIQLFDGDKLIQHNAFRSPGAPSIEELRAMPYKVDYFQKLYSRIHRHIIANQFDIDASNVERLRDATFVFLCIDDGAKSGQVLAETPIRSFWRRLKIW